MSKSRLYDSRVKDHVVVHLGLNVKSSTHNCGCIVHLGLNVNSSTHNCGCMVDRVNAMAVICVLLLL